MLGTLNLLKRGTVMTFGMNGNPADNVESRGLPLLLDLL